MHGKDFENLPEHIPDSVCLICFKYFFSGQNVSVGQSILVHSLQRFLYIVHALLFGSDVRIDTRKIEIRHVELKNVAKQNASLKLF